MEMFTIKWKLYPLNLCKLFKKNWCDVKCARTTLCFQILLGDKKQKVWPPPSYQSSENYTMIISYTHSGTSETLRLKLQILWIHSRNSTIRPPPFHLIIHQAQKQNLCFSSDPKRVRRSGHRLVRRLTASHWCPTPPLTRCLKIIS